MQSQLCIRVSLSRRHGHFRWQKPDAITTMYKSEFKQKAWSLPVADLLYVGKSTNRKLALFGIKTIGDLARADEDVLNSHLGKMGSILWSFANGYDDSPVKLENTHAPIKSVGNSTTTPKDLVCDEDVKIVLYILAESVAARLRENGFLFFIFWLRVLQQDFVRMDSGAEWLR